MPHSDQLKLQSGVFYRTATTWGLFLVSYTLQRPTEASFWCVITHSGQLKPLSSVLYPHLPTEAFSVVLYRRSTSWSPFFVCYTPQRPAEASLWCYTPQRPVEASFYCVIPHSNQLKSLSGVFYPTATNWSLFLVCYTPQRPTEASFLCAIPTATNWSLFLVCYTTQRPTESSF